MEKSVKLYQNIGFNYVCHKQLLLILEPVLVKILERVLVKIFVAENKWLS